GHQEVPEGAIEVPRWNPLCGDEVLVAVATKGQRVHLRADADGCAISQASASILADSIDGGYVRAALDLTASVIRGLVDDHADADRERELGDASALFAVRAFPVRIACAAMPWYAAQE